MLSQVVMDFAGDAVALVHPDGLVAVLHGRTKGGLCAYGQVTGLLLSGQRCVGVREQRGTAQLAAQQQQGGSAEHDQARRGQHTAS